ncbi:MAG: methyltransferase domain-containing protein, partial [Burkholderiales bacterium]
MSWDPAQYLKFAGERTRPALDLLARIPAAAPETVVDLGCGAGNLAPLLMARWPGAKLTGVDSSPEMLARARARLADRENVRLVRADMRALPLRGAFDLVVAADDPFSHLTRS